MRGERAGVVHVAPGQLRLPGEARRAYRNGDNLTLDGADTGARTWETFLAERLPQPGGRVGLPR
ncbi:hypothetical protein ABZ671_16650 [Micromonospora sp. NPDC006766]|uniref:hypothetical protein n=1 Tax=Micromonospora sp. NPDC006766 TaxID=3154778 RepID=UPI0033E389D0